MENPFTSAQQFPSALMLGFVKAKDLTYRSGWLGFLPYSKVDEVEELFSYDSASLSQT
jgi:hypothetical protein